MEQSQAYWFFYFDAANDLTLPRAASTTLTKLFEEWRAVHGIAYTEEIDTHLPLRILDHVPHIRDLPLPRLAAERLKTPSGNRPIRSYFSDLVTGHAGMRQHPRAAEIYCGH